MEILEELGISFVKFRNCMDDYEPEHHTKVDFAREEQRQLEERRRGGTHGYRTRREFVDIGVQTDFEENLKPTKTLKKIDTQVSPIAQNKSPAAATARLFALASKHAQLLNEINDLNEEIDFLTKKLARVEGQLESYLQKKRSMVKSSYADYLGYAFVVDKTLKLYFSQDGRVAIQELPIDNNQWDFLI